MKYEFGLAKLANEFEKSSRVFVGIAIKQEFGLGSTLTSFDHICNVFLNFSNWNLSFEFFIRWSESYFDLVCNSFHINNFIAVLGKLVADLCLSCERSSCNNTEFGEVAHSVTEKIIVPAVHSSQSELFLEKSVNIELSQVVSFKLNNAVFCC